MGPGSKATAVLLLVCAAGFVQGGASWVHTLDQVTRQAGMGIMTRAPNSPLHHFVQKLLQPGANITVVGVGGSFCHALNLPNPAERYLDRLEAGLRAWAPTAASIRVVNNCAGATTPSHTVICLDRYLVNDNVDLVLVDYLGNLGIHVRTVHDATVSSYEMLLRRLLTWPGSPAILQVHTIQPFPRSPSFAHSAEDAINVLGQYYGVPFVSARNALWLKQQFPQPSNAMNMDIRDPGDKFHYNALGHTYVTDLIMTALENVATDLAAYGNTAGALHSPVPLSPALVAPHISDVRYLQCVLPNELATLVVEKGNWYFRADDKRAVKPGYVSLAMGSPLVLRVPPLPPVVQPGAVFDVLVGFLKSYVGMGSATISCRGGCSCDSVVVSARTTERVSMTNYQHVHITTANASGAVAPCDLVFDRVPDADGTIGKWKLSNFVLLENLPHEVVEHTIAQQADEPVQ